jgi:hypothetical protein
MGFRRDFLITQKSQHRSVPMATMNGLTVHAKGLSLRPTTLEISREQAKYVSFVCYALLPALHPFPL